MVVQAAHIIHGCMINMHYTVKFQSVSNESYIHVPWLVAITTSTYQPVSCIALSIKACVALLKSPLKAMSAPF